VHAVDHDVDGGDRARACAHDGRVVAEPALESIAIAATQGRRDGVDQAQLAQKVPLPVSVDDARAVEVVRRDLDPHPVPREDPDAEAAHLAGDVSEDCVTVVELHAEHGVRQCLDDLTLELDLLFLRQAR
jgi:hypothetical protein